MRSFCGTIPQMWRSWIIGVMAFTFGVLLVATDTCSDPIGTDPNWSRNVDRYCRSIRTEDSVNRSLKAAVQSSLKPWWMYYWEPNWSCPFEERVMWRSPDALVTSGDGGKWTCNVPALAADSDCLIYSFGSAGDFSFEIGMLDLLKRLGGRCEIHTFDIATVAPVEDYPAEAFAQIHRHLWGLDIRDHTFTLFDHATGTSQHVVMKSLSSIMKDLGHSGRILHILKVDIEGGEFGTLNSPAFWRALTDSGTYVEQLLFELHFQRPPLLPGGPEEWEPGAGIVRPEGGATAQDVDQFLRALTREGFVLFHKEVNLLALDCSEFSMLRVNVSCPSDESEGAGDGGDAYQTQRIVSAMVKRMEAADARWDIESTIAGP